MQAGGCRSVTGNKAWAPLHKITGSFIIQSSQSKLLHSTRVHMYLSTWQAHFHSTQFRYARSWCLPGIQSFKFHSALWLFACKFNTVLILTPYMNTNGMSFSTVLCRGKFEVLCQYLPYINPALVLCFQVWDAKLDPFAFPIFLVSGGSSGM